MYVSTSRVYKCSYVPEYFGTETYSTVLIREDFENVRYVPYSMLHKYLYMLYVVLHAT